tara:strand:+ start:581 stop:1150 length:570 start_codon:yes stop_codon:yes gene_type:complete
LTSSETENVTNFTNLKTYFYNTILSTYDKSMMLLTIKRKSSNKIFQIIAYCDKWPKLPLPKQQRYLGPVGVISKQMPGVGKTWIRSSVKKEGNKEMVSDDFETKYVSANTSTIWQWNTMDKYLFTFGQAFDIEIQPNKILIQPGMYNHNGDMSWNGTGKREGYAPKTYFHTALDTVELIRVDMFGVETK